MVTESDPESIFIKIHMRNTRKIIFDILLEYFSKNKNLGDLIDRNLKLKNYKPQDRNLIYQISKGVVRRYLTLDFLISEISGIKIKNIDFLSLIALRIALFQIIFLNRIPDYSSVNESVELIKEIKGQKSANFVNAVLRKATRIKNLYDFLEERIKKIKDKIKKESIRYSFPEWLTEYWMQSYSSDSVRRIFESLNKNPEFYFRVNTLKISEKILYELITSAFGNSYEIFLDGASFKLKDNLDKFMNSEFISNGFTFVQNLSSQFAVTYFLNPQPGEKILDICSAPGGKSISSAIKMKNTGEIFAVESNEKRFEILEDNLKKMSAGIVKSINADAARSDFLHFGKENKSVKLKKSHKNYNEYFDKIFFDMPCSSFGTISKNPDAKYNKNIDKLTRLKENAIRIIENTEPYLKRGGRIIFYTCTLSKIENEDVINYFLDSHKGRYIVDNRESLKKMVNENIKDFPELKNLLSSTEKIIEIMPYYLNSEAASICSLIKVK